MFDEVEGVHHKKWKNTAVSSKNGGRIVFRAGLIENFNFNQGRHTVRQKVRLLPKVRL